MQTATNPQTGETAVLIDGSWQKAEKTAANDKGEKAYFVGGKWLSDTSPVKTAQPSEKPVTLSVDGVLSTAAQLARGFLPVVGATQNTKAMTETMNKGADYAGGRVTDVAANLGAPPEVAAGLGLAANVGVQAIPSLVGMYAGRQAAPIVEDSARSLMQSAIKPTLKDLQTGKAQRAVQTMLDEGINPTMAGMEKIRSKASAIEDAVSAAIQGSGKTVDKGIVASRLQDLVSNIESKNPTPQQARAAVESVYDQFISNGLIPKNIPVEQAQRFKQGIYEAIGKKYGELGSDTIEAQKALARGLKEEIAKAVPSVSDLNAKASDLWNALSVAERKALLQTNNNPGGLALLTQNVPQFLAFMADKSQAFKGLVARMLYSNSQAIPGAIGAAGGAAVGNVAAPVIWPPSK